MINKNKKLLFAIDLDGTLLKSESDDKIDEKCINAIKKAKELGHVVLLVTGRPWRSTIEIYEKLELNTTVVNYNGAFIHNPSDPEFIPEIKYLNLNEALYVLGDKELKKYAKNIVIEGPGWVHMQKRSDDLERVFGLNTIRKFKVGIDYEKFPLKPTGVIIDIKKGTDYKKLLRHLRRNYGDLTSFSSWSKGNDDSRVFDITAIGAEKDAAIILMSRYYDVDVDNIMAIGDGFNDIPMFKIAGVSVAMKNASDLVKKYATHIAKNDNNNGGVGEMIEIAIKNWDKLLAKAKIIREKSNNEY